MCDFILTGTHAESLEQLKDKVIKVLAPRKIISDKTNKDGKGGKGQDTNGNKKDGATGTGGGDKDGGGNKDGKDGKDGGKDGKNADGSPSGSPSVSMDSAAGEDKYDEWIADL